MRMQVSFRTFAAVALSAALTVSSLAHAAGAEKKPKNPEAAKAFVG